MHKVIVSSEEVRKISKLASLRLVDNEVDLFAKQFTETIDVINELNEIDTSGVSETYQVNGLSNITREDVVDKNRILPREIALRESRETHEGFFVVPRIIDTESSETDI